MIKGVWNRLFGFYKEGAVLVGKWTVSSGATTKVAAESHNSLSIVDTGSGLYQLVVAGGFRNAVVMALYVTNPDSDDPTDTRDVFIDQELGGVSSSAGKVYFSTMSPEEGAVALAIAVPADGSQIHAVLYINK